MRVQRHDAVSGCGDAAVSSQVRRKNTRSVRLTTYEVVQTMHSDAVVSHDLFREKTVIFRTDMSYVSSV
jgi:hypothetical protein